MGTFYSWDSNYKIVLQNSDVTGCVYTYCSDVNVFGKMDVHCFQIFLSCIAVQPPLYTLTCKHHLYFILQQMFFLHSSFSFIFPLLCALFCIFISECDCTPLQYFYDGSIQSNKKVAVSQLIHSIYCGGAVFSYEAHEIRQDKGL
jgi:predicted membrane protein